MQHIYVLRNIYQLLKLKPSSKLNEITLKINLVSVAHSFCKLKPEQNSVIKTKEIRDSFTKIKSTEQVVISKPDKGIVIFNKNDYISKMLKIVSDETKFKNKDL